MTQAIQSLTGGEPRPVQVAELEAELSALWRSAAEDPENRQAVTRACALTLLVYVESAEAGREVGNLISAVTLQNPCRAVVMIAEGGATPPGLTAWISAVCHLPAAGEKQVCCEQVSVLARGEAVRDLDNVVLPLAVPGLPVYLWWRAGRFAPPEYFGQILRLANRVLVDSARFPDPEVDLASLAGQIRKFSGRVTFSDLNWGRITPWRDVIAQCFDAADTRGYLDSLRHVRIEYEQESPRVVVQAAQSLLLAGWLASRLKWEPEKRRAEQGSGTRSFFFKTAHGLVEVERVPRTFEGGGAGVCFSITMQAGGVPPATFSLQRGPDGKNAMTRRVLGGRLPVEGSVRLEVFDEVELVNEEMKFSGRDRIYEEAMAAVAQMVG